MKRITWRKPTCGCSGLRSLLTVQLYRRMGERRIDIVMTDLGTADDRLIVTEARRQALELVHT